MPFCCLAHPGDADVALRLSVWLREGELTAMVVKVLGSEVVDVGECHDVFEERVPADREVHGAVKRSFLLGVEVLVEVGDRPLEQRVNLSGSRHSAAADGSQIVDDVKWSGCRIQDCREAPTGAVGKASEQVDQWQ